MGRYLMFGCVVAAGLLLAVPARAQLTERERAEAAVLRVKQGIALQQAGKHEEALPLFEQAWALSPHPKALFYRGRSLIALKRWDEAHVTYQLIRKNRMDLEADKLEEVEANLALCEQQVAVKQPGLAPAPVSAVVARPAQAPAPADSVDLTATTRDATRAQAEEKKGGNALTWWLVGGGAAALVIGSVVSGVLLANRNSGGEPAPNKVWTLPAN